MFEKGEIAMMTLKGFLWGKKVACVNYYVYYNCTFSLHAEAAFAREEFGINILQGVNPSRPDRQRNDYPLLINGDLRD